jgi:2,4-dienoyl-CoA reductase-like NADH-dependent reductase (Old Yellow Enzyme family)
VGVILLFEPYRLRSVTFRNRVWMAPMCQYSADAEGPDVGAPNDWHFSHLAARATGGTGLVLSEATAVSPAGRISRHDLGIWNDRQADAFGPITRFISEQGAVPGIQLAHAGRKASTQPPWDGGAPVLPDHGGWRPVGPSPIPYDERHPTPHELSTSEIAGIVEEFREATRRSLRAGFQVVEIHGAHGYLLHEFLSPHSNHRTDAYGGSWANRTRLAREVTEAVRGEWPDELPVLFRVSATDWLVENDDPRPGWTVEQTIALAAGLRRLGVDLIDVSSGANAAGVTIPADPGYQVPFARRIKDEAGVATGAVGLITEPAQAEKVLVSGDADVVLLGRELLRDPYWALHAARDLGVNVVPPVQYGRAL